MLLLLQRCTSQVPVLLLLQRCTSFTLYRYRCCCCYKGVRRRYRCCCCYKGVRRLPCTGTGVVVVTKVYVAGTGVVVVTKVYVVYLTKSFNNKKLTGKWSKVHSDADRELWSAVQNQVIAFSVGQELQPWCASYPKELQYCGCRGTVMDAASCLSVCSDIGLRSVYRVMQV